MANEEQLAILTRGVDIWNEWRRSSSEPIDLSGAVLTNANLSQIDLRNSRLNDANRSNTNLIGARLTQARLLRTTLDNANLTRADLRGADLGEASLAGANLDGATMHNAMLSDAIFVRATIRQAHMNRVNLHRADLSEADLTGAHINDASLINANLCKAILITTSLGATTLWGADLSHADLRQATLSFTNLMNTNFTAANLAGADLSYARMIGTRLQGANLSSCRIFGISAWNVNLEGAKEKNLRITETDEPRITVDSLEIAQFIYLLLHNEKLRDVIDTISTKAVLILGRFARMDILDAISDALREHGYIPIIFKFDPPENRDLTETMSTLAHLSRFIIADLTDPSSIPHELATIVPHLRTVAILPIILKGNNAYGMFQDFQAYPWVLPIHEYESQAQLIAELPEKVIEPAEKKVDELRPAK